MFLFWLLSFSSSIFVLFYCFSFRAFYFYFYFYLFFIYFGFFPPHLQVFIMVLKSRPDRTIRPGKLQTSHFCSCFNLKNRSMEKKKSRDPCELRSDLMVLWTVNGSCCSHKSLLKKKKIKALNGIVPEYLLYFGRKKKKSASK